MDLKAAQKALRSKYRTNGTTRESAVKEKYEKLGFTVLRNGWPDFLCYREENGKKRFIGVEVKSAGSKARLSKEQQTMTDVLPFECVIEVVD